MIRLFGEEQPGSAINLIWDPHGLQVELAFVSTLRRATATDLEDASQNGKAVQGFRANKIAGS